jgi:hypothetical protein
MRLVHLQVSETYDGSDLKSCTPFPGVGKQQIGFKQRAEHEVPNNITL